jgi:prevent-host-death family protein
MNKIISAADANRRFSKLLKEAKNGTSYTITSHGEVVAELNPPSKDAKARKLAFETLMKRLESQKPVDVGPWTREELYDRDAK